MPNPDVLDKILELYLNTSGKGRPNVTLFDTLVTATGNVFKSITRQSTDAATIELCEDVKKQFRPKDRQRLEKNIPLSFNEWIDAVHYLGEKSKKVQKNKITVYGLLERDASRLCNTLHALRNYIVLALKSEYPDEFAAKIEHLKNGMNTSTKKASESACKNLDVTMFVDKENKKLLYLAYLEDSHSISEANQRGLFEDLIHLNGDPRNNPCCLQEDFCRVFYKKKYQKHTKISFEDFESKAIKQANLKRKFSSNTDMQNQVNEAEHSDSEGEMRPGF